MVERLFRVPDLVARHVASHLSDEVEGSKKGKTSGQPPRVKSEAELKKSFPKRQPVPKVSSDEMKQFISDNSEHRTHGEHSREGAQQRGTRSREDTAQRGDRTAQPYRIVSSDLLVGGSDEGGWRGIGIPSGR